MTEDTMPLIELLRKCGADKEVDFLRLAVEEFLAKLMEAQVSDRIGAALNEQSEDRTTHRNGYRKRLLNTRVGGLSLEIPKIRKGTYFPSFLEPRRMTEKALMSVVQEAYIHGVSTRKVDDLVQALGLEGMDKSQVSRICAELDERIEAFRQRPLKGAFPYLWLDATYLKVRQDGRVVNMAMVIAIAVNMTGEREVAGFELGPAEDQAFWLQFLRSLVARGLGGVQLVISDAHEGLKQAIAAVFNGASWQRCRVHFMRNVLSHVKKDAQSVVAATIRTVFAQPDLESARKQLKVVATELSKRFPKVQELLLKAGEEVLAYMSFPSEHWRQLHSTNPLERLNREIKRRSDVVGIFPTRNSALRLAGATLMEQGDEWTTCRRYFSQESMAKLDREYDDSAALGRVPVPANV